VRRSHSNQQNQHSTWIHRQRAKEGLAAALWSSNSIIGNSNSTNTELAGVLEVLLRNTYRGGEGHANQQALRLEGIFTNLQRCQSQKQMPLIPARLSIAAKRCQLHGNMWRSISLLALASEHWTDDFVNFSRRLRPACEYKALPGVGGVMFDNYTRKVLYSSQRTVDGGGYLLNMTNSASFTIPKSLAGPRFDANQLCASCTLLTTTDLLLTTTLTTTDYY